MPSAVESGQAMATSGCVPLMQLSREDAPWAGAKAANLGELLRAGLPVPAGFVLTADAEAHLAEILSVLGNQPVAVRSSGAAEDLADASFAGQYETVLNVRGVDQLRQAIRQCRESAGSQRVQRYRRQRAAGAAEEMAVLVQRMVAADAAGVAFSANPLTGERGQVIVTSVVGLGERLVSGEAVPDDWLVEGDAAVCRRSSEGAITAAQALAIAELARRAEQLFGSPQDIEWAIEASQLYLLQSRPITSLPEPAVWQAPGGGYWMRNFRLGEWLPEPVTPLFEDWLLPCIHAGFAHATIQDVGVEYAPHYVNVNGWYYTSPIPGGGFKMLAEGLARHPATLMGAIISLATQTRRPRLADRLLIRGLIARWEDELLPRYRSLVDDCGARIDAASPAELAEVVGLLGAAAGECFWSLAGVGGSAWKVEAALAAFFRAHLAGRVETEVTELLAGLVADASGAPPHAVQSADWYRPTLGELPVAREPVKADRMDHTKARRLRAEADCRAALRGRPRLLRRFDDLLALAQRYGRLREQQATDWTLAWPRLRLYIQRLGDLAQQHGAVAIAEDAFFLTRDELLIAAASPTAEDLSGTVAQRRTTWERQRRLMAPLAIGEAPRLMARELGALESLRKDEKIPEDALAGQPASPGRASGRVRILRGPEEFLRFQAGEVLVASSTSPGWTPLFSLAAAVVTDGGSLAAHASLVAREYGIPAVVATQDATHRLADGQWVTVDGSSGYVLLGVHP